MGLYGGTQIKTNMTEFSAECHSVDCSGDSRVFTELGSNKIKVIVLDDQKSREWRRIRGRALSV